LSDGFKEFLEDQFSVVDGASLRRMFGGLGVFHDGIMFALVDHDTLYFRADAETIPLFEAEGCEQFVYEAAKTKRLMPMPYWRAPERLYDDPDAFREWSERSIALAKRDKAAKKPAKRKR
jgi:DNA transformation protein